MKTQSLQRQFKLWTIVLIVVPSLLIMLIYTISQIKISKQQNLELISQRVSSQNRLIEYWIEERVSDVRDLGQSNSFRTLDEPQMERNLYAKLQNNKNFDSLSYIDKDGSFRMSTLNGGIQHKSAIGQPYFQQALTGKNYISDVVIGRNSGVPIINFSFPIVDYDGNFQGLILGSVKTATLETLLHDNWIGQTGEVFLINREGTMLTELRYVNVLIDKGLVKSTAKMNFKITDDAFDKIHLGESGTATWIDYLGNKVLGAYLDVPARNWTLIGKINEEEVLSPIYQHLAIMATGVLLLILLFLPLATLITKGLKRPLDWLIHQSSLITTEKYDQVGRDTPSKNIPHELGVLCDNFVKMSHKIENTIGLLKDNEANLAHKVLEIQDINAILEEEISERQTAEEALFILNAELETKVRERSQDLQDVNAILEEEISERQATGESLRDHRDALLLSEIKLKHYASELVETNNELKSFANSVAHDFRAPMVNMKGFSVELGYALADLQDIINDNKTYFPENHHQRVDELLGQDVPAALNFINTSVDKLERMIAALLSLARLGRRDIIDQEVDMNETVKTVLRSFNHQIEKQDIHVEIGSLPKIATDYLAIEQIISNLLDNAIKYLEPGRPGKIKIYSTDHGADYLISVQDNGCGIAPADYEKIFDIFRRVGNQTQPGEGMGLSYIKTLIRQLNGKVWCESALGVGTTFNFTVPKDRSYGSTPHFDKIN